jgi:glutathione S-transferase
MLLFTALNSICTQKVLITLFEKGLSWDTKRVDLFKNEQYDPAYLKYNPKGVVPTLVHDDKPIIESTLICEYLDETFPLPSLVPPTPYDRAQMRLWSKQIDEGIFEATREISFSAMFREKLRNMTDEQRNIRFNNVGDPSRGARFRSTYEHGTDSPYVLYAVASFEKMFSTMSDVLADGRKWLVTDDLTLGDINLMPFVARLEYLNMLDIFIDERPRVQVWWTRSKELSSYKKAIPEMLDDEDITTMKISGAKIREQIRTRREEHLAQCRQAGRRSASSNSAASR